MYLIDTHIHLTDTRYSELGIESLLLKAKTINLNKLVTTGVDVCDSTQALKLAEENESIFFCVGVHPHEADKYNEKDLDDLKSLLKHPKCVGVGETGLDYYYEFSHKESQVKVFIQMLELAYTTNKPIVLHTRSAEKEVLDIIKTFPNRYHCHSYTGDINLINEYLELGAVFSFNGMVTFKTAENVREIAKKVPLDRIMVESDGPYLAPVPYRGKINLPEYLKETVLVLSECLDVSYDEMVEITTKNAERFFWNDL